jgi:hypothetical protein
MAGVSRDQTRDTTVWTCSECSWRIMRMTRDIKGGDAEALVHERLHGLFNGSAATRVRRAKKG